MRIRPRRWLIVALSVGALTVVAAIGLATRIPISSDALRARVIAALSDQLNAEVELGGLTLRLYPRLRASGEGLTVRFHERHDVPPLVSIREFTIDADLMGLWRHRVARVSLTGLEINIPPNDHTDDQPTEAEADDVATHDATAGSTGGDIVIEELDAPEAQLTILRSDPAKQPRIWYLHHLTMRTVGVATKMPFDAVLTNAVPPGQIATTGTFGPWQRGDPGATPLDGRFTFEHADLSVFKGISGILSAHGTYEGALDRIVVNGQTDTPDFMVTLSGHQVPLRTTYRAVVDATNGNTTLDPVDATVLDTEIVARGGVYEVEGVHGRVVKLDVTIDDGHLEDVMRMAVKTSQSPMTGGLRLSTSLTIPPGKQDVVEKLQLDGRFAIDRGHFTDPGVQAKINDLSRRASLRKTEAPAQPTRVTSDFSGRFKLDNSRLSLTALTFDVPGAVVALNGAYHLRQETLAFNGDLFMDAKISETTTGVKALLLRIADPIFRHNGKTRIPLQIHGTRNDPQFGLDMKRVFTK